MKREFIRRLIRLRYYIDLAIKRDDSNILMPALYSVVSFLWTDYKAVNHNKYGKRR